MDSGVLELPMASDLAPYWDVTTTPGGTTFQDMTGWAMQFVVRRTNDDAVVFSTTSVSVGNDDSGHTGARATATITDADITGWTPGNGYYGSLWRTDDGSDTPVWTGPVRLVRTAAQV